MIIIIIISFVCTIVIIFLNYSVPLLSYISVCISKFIIFNIIYYYLLLLSSLSHYYHVYYIDYENKINFCCSVGIDTIPERGLETDHVSAYLAL